MLNSFTLYRFHGTIRIKYNALNEGGNTLEEETNDFLKEEEDMMNAKEVARAIEYLRFLGLTEKQINDFLVYVGTGVGLPIESSDKD